MKSKVVSSKWESAFLTTEEAILAEKLSRYRAMFAEVKRALGVRDLDEFNETFSAREDQNFAIVQHINHLNEEASQLEEHIDKVKTKAKNVVYVSVLGWIVSPISPRLRLSPVVSPALYTVPCAPQSPGGSCPVRRRSRPSLYSTHRSCPACRANQTQCDVAPLFLQCIHVWSQVPQRCMHGRVGVFVGQAPYLTGSFGIAVHRSPTSSTDGCAHTRACTPPIDSPNHTHKTHERTSHTRAHDTREHTTEEST
jgi:hypothetical protein